MISPVVVFVPSEHSRSGTFSLIGNAIVIRDIDCDSGRTVRIHFYATNASIEFFVINTQFYDVNSPEILPVVSFCEYHVIAQSADYQFITERNGPWYFVFKNNPIFAESLQEQRVHYEWIDSSQIDAAMPLITSTLVFGSIILGSIILILFVRVAYIKRKNGAAGVI